MKEKVDGIKDLGDLQAIDPFLTSKFLKIFGPDHKIFQHNEQTNLGNWYTKFEYYWMSFRFLVSDFKFKYMIFYISISLMGFQVAEFVYSWHLLDIIQRSDTLKNVITSVTHNFKQLILTAFLGMIIIYVYAILGFYFLDDTYYDDNIEGGARSCVSILHCYMSTQGFVREFRVVVVVVGDLCRG